MLAGLGLGLLSRGLGQTTVPAPAQVLDLTQWKLTLPTGNPGSPTEILQLALGASAATNYFTVLPAGNGVVFTAPCGGVTTSGSSYPRSELRQMDGDGTTLASWSTLRDTNIMEVIEAVLNLPVAKPELMCGQIHDSSTKIVDFRLDGATLFLEVNGSQGPVLDPNYVLGRVFTGKWIVHDGGIDTYFNGQFISTTPSSQSGCYFKAGCYTQSNPSHCDSPTAYGQVVIYGLTVSGPAGPEVDLAVSVSVPADLVAGQDFDY